MIRSPLVMETARFVMASSEQHMEHLYEATIQPVIAE